MGNLFCNAPDSAHLAAVARDFCPFPDYSPGPLYNVMYANSSQLLSEHYAAVQASLMPQQQQDFTRALRGTFGKEGKVSYGGVGVVALSLAVLFDTVAKQVKGEYMYDQEPIPGLFVRSPTGTYDPLVHTVSKYLRLVPYIANSPSRMADETERYLLQIKRELNRETDAKRVEDIAAVNAVRCYMISKHMLAHLQTASNKTVDLKEIKPSNVTHKDPEFIFTLNCDPKVASERFLAELESLGPRTKQAFESCEPSKGDKSVIENIAYVEWFMHVFSGFLPEEATQPERHFDLKANALGTWI